MRVSDGTILEFLSSERLLMILGLKKIDEITLKIMKRCDDIKDLEITNDLVEYIVDQDIERIKKQFDVFLKDKELVSKILKIKSREIELEQDSDWIDLNALAYCLSDLLRENEIDGMLDRPIDRELIDEINTFDDRYEEARTMKRIANRIASHPYYSFYLDSTWVHQRENEDIYYVYRRVERMLSDIEILKTYMKLHSELKDSGGRA